MMSQELNEKEKKLTQIVEQAKEEHTKEEQLKRPVFKKYKVPKNGHKPPTTITTPSQSQPQPQPQQTVLLRVKRLRDQEPLEELELQFDKGGVLKRRKLVTESQALVKRFNQSLALNDSSSAVAEEKAAKQDKI